MPLSPLRILSNNRNLLREAVLAASSVEAVENSVRALDAERTGTAAVSLIGSYTGDDEAVIDIEIIDDTPESRLASAPVQSGVGTGEISGISVTGLDAQTIKVECREAGSPAVAATLSFEGVKLVAAEPGDTSIHINVDQSTIEYEPTIYSLLVPLRAGEGGATTGISGTAGAGLDFDTAVLANNIIPAGAHRIAFADDRAAIYLAYKEFVNREWVYHFVPAIQHDVAAGTAVLFVTGGRTVTITDGSDAVVTSPPPVETFIPTFVIYYGGGPALTTPDAARLAKYGLIDIDRFRYNQIGANTWNAIKAYNPDVEVYLYEMGPEAPNYLDATAAVSLNGLGRYDVSRGHSLGSLNGSHTDLFQLDAGSARIYSLAFSSPPDYWHLMDFGNGTYQSYWNEAVNTDVVTQAWAADGIFADNCLTFASDGGYSAPSVTYATDAAWSTAMNAFSSAIAAGMHALGQKLWINKGGSRTALGKAAWIALDGTPDVMLEEGFVAVSYGSADVQFFVESEWKNQVDTVAGCSNSKVALNAHTNLAEGASGTDNWSHPVTFWQILHYAIGSMLLGKRAANNAHLMFSTGPDYNYLPWYDEFDDINLGAPVGDYTITPTSGVNIYWREFELGYVAVNPTENNVASFAFPQDVRQITHATLATQSSNPVVSTVAIPGHSAAIVLKTNFTSIIVGDVETYPDIETVYDLLSRVKAESALVTVDGVVKNDRSPTGQAARELLVRTDAHAGQSTGSGSAFATGFASVLVNEDASTELITAKCYAATVRDHPLASLGRERWEVVGSLSGKLADAVTGVPYLGPTFGFVIPERLPPGIGTPRGRFSVTGFSYAPREAGEVEPPICPVALTLGAAAVDQTITLTYARRPSGGCDCEGMPVGALSGDCLGITELNEEAVVDFSDEALPRVKALYDWANTLVTALSRYIAGFASDGVPEDYVYFNDTTVAGSRTSQDGVTFSGSTTFAQDTSLGPINFAGDPTVKVTGFADVAIPDNFQSVIDSYERALKLIDAVTDYALKMDGFAQWDLSLGVFQTDLDGSVLTSLGDRLKTMAAEKYNVLLRQSLAYAGISPMGKSDASILDSGDGCWRDFGDAMWWEVQGSEGGNYAPLFTNRPYVSSKRATNGRFYSTREFGLQVNIKCPQYLKVGDKIFLSISDSGWGSTYGIGDTLLLPLIAKRDLYLTGGRAGDPTQQWFVSLSKDGPFPVYLLNPDVPIAYSSGGLSFVIFQGGIPFAKGDRFEFAIVGGHWKWRVNGGAWQSESPPNEITSEAQAFYEGLSVLFAAGAAPCFVAGDRYSFRVWQPWSSSNVRSPRVEMWKWGGSDSAVMVWDIGAVQAIESVALGAHEIPEGATITLEGGDEPDTWLWSEELTWREGVMYAELAERSARYLRLTLDDAVGGALGWVFAGPALTTSLQSEGSFAPAYKVNRADSGLFQGGRFLGKTIDGEISWTGGALSEEDVSNITETLDWTKEHDDEQLIVVPNVTRPHEAFLGRIDADRVEFPDLFTWGPNAGKARRHSARLPFAGAWR